MRRLPTMLASASAAALATVAITVAVPAIADDAGGDGTKGADPLSACLRDHGLAGAPGGAALKPWLGPRLERGDAATQQAMKECAPKPTMTEAPGPSEQQVRSCLSDHGVAIPGGDAFALKRWLMDHGDDAANREAMKACHVGPPGKPAAVGPCGGKERGVVQVVHGGPADKPAPVQPGRAGAQGTSGAD
jgi:hypothetical protein